MKSKTKIKEMTDKEEARVKTYFDLDHLSLFINPYTTFDLY